MIGGGSSSSRSPSSPSPSSSPQAPPISHGIQDPRNVRSGSVVHDIGGYYDGQSLASTPSCLSLVYHHCHNHEGGPGLRLYHCTSADDGRTWTDPTPIEESLTSPSHDGYQLVHPTNHNTVYLIYGFNEGHIHHTSSSSAANAHVDLPRGDMQLEEGFRLKVSTDGGRTYPKERHTIPVRRTAIDDANPWGGKTIGAFHCDKPIVIGESVYFAFQKTPEGGGETPNAEVFIMSSPDLLTQKDPSKATWLTLPEGPRGLQWPSRLNLGEEPHVLPVTSPRHLQCIWRTEVGVIASSTSRDGGATFSPPSPLAYTPGGYPVKNPRGSLTPHRFPDGRVLLIFYNNSHTEREGYCGRRYYFYTLGTPTSSGFVWSQPELALWWDGESLDDRPGWNADWAIVDGPGYCDFCELPGGTLAFVESNKLTLRMHKVDPRVLHYLGVQGELSELPLDPAVRLRSPSGRVRSMGLPDLQSRGGGYSIVVRMTCPTGVGPGEVLLDSREVVTKALDEEETGDYVTKGYTLATEGRGPGGIQLCLTLYDGRGMCRARTDGVRWDGSETTVTFIVDAGPRIVTAVAGGRLCDGGDTAPEGWTVVDPKFGAAGGASVVFKPDATYRRPHAGPFKGEILDFIIYDRPLLTTEAIGAGRALGNVINSKL